MLPMEQGQVGMVGRSESSCLVNSLDLGAWQSSTSQSAPPNLGNFSTLLLLVPLCVHGHRVVEGISIG